MCHKNLKARWSCAKDRGHLASYDVISGQSPSSKVPLSFGGRSLERFSSHFLQKIDNADDFFRFFFARQRLHIMTIIMSYWTQFFVQPILHTEISISICVSMSHTFFACHSNVVGLSAPKIFATRKMLKWGGRMPAPPRYATSGL